MNLGLILAGGVGQRMRSSGLPKQFLEVFRKPIIIYTIEKFENCDDIDSIIIVCNSNWIEYMNSLLMKYQFTKPVHVLSGGKDRQKSIENGIQFIVDNGGSNEDIIVIHDGVRPLIETTIISENVKLASRKGCCMTVKPVVESVIITRKDEAKFIDFKKRDDTYSLTAPQTFKLSMLIQTYKEIKGLTSPFPLLDTALAYTFLGNDIPIVKENNHNIKITTPEDYYILKAILELEENKAVFGLQ